MVELPRMIEGRDLGIAILKGTISGLPFVGGIVAEVIGTLIPDWRLERIQKFLGELETRVASLERERLQSRFRNQEFIDVFEDSMRQASRALSEERIAHIASVMEDSLKAPEFEHEKTKRVLNILEELTDIEILFLQYHALPPSDKRAFFERHKFVLSPPPLPTSGASREELEAKELFDARVSHLVRLGLLRQRFQSPDPPRIPHGIDPNTGMEYRERVYSTALGRLVLGTIGLRPAVVGDDHQ